MNEFYFFAIKKLLGILLLYSHYLLLVSVGQPKNSLANHRDTMLTEAMYSCGGKSEILHEVLCTDLIFQDREFTDLPLHLKLLLDNLQAAFTLIQKSLFQKTLKALELYLVNIGAFIEALGCQLPGKEDGDSSSTKIESQSLESYLMRTSFSKLHSKIQQKTRLAIRNFTS